MLDKKIRILNLDNSIIAQKALLSHYETEIVDLLDLGRLARNWANTSTRNRIEERISNSTKNSITLMGSGDFHHISEVLISQFNKPICVIVFDFHPDWSILPPRFGCGSWVTEVLKKDNIAKLILIGPSSSDLSTLNIQSANLHSLENDRIEIYPYEHAPSLALLKKIPKNISLKIQNRGVFSKICWEELKNKDLPNFFKDLLGRLPEKRVYVSIDKDCLKGDYALTNWEEGPFSLDELILMLKLIKENTDVIGADIVGDYSNISVKGIFKRMASYLDHPRDVKAMYLDEVLVTKVNGLTNLEILRCLGS